MTNREKYGVAAIVCLCLAVIVILLYLLKGPTHSAATPSPTPEVKGSPQTVTGTLPVNQPWKFIGRFKGRVAITVTGTAILAPKEGPVGPEGNGVSAGSAFALPGESAFCVLAKYNNKVEKVGSYKEIYFETETPLFLGPNEESLQSPEAKGFTDNSGSFTYKIVVK